MTESGGKRTFAAVALLFSLIQYIAAGGHQVCLGSEMQNWTGLAHQMVRIVPFEVVPEADLLVDSVYEGEAGGQISGEALSKLLPGVGNQGGFRAPGRGEDKKFIVLYTSGEDPDWPDRLDNNTGQFVYFGDNKKPGHELHDTGPGGNRMLRRAFDSLHANPPRREDVPPYFIFKKYPTATSSRSVQFKGLAVPGFTGLPATSDLVAIWKTTKGNRFQNYQATFTVLDTEIVTRKWLDDLATGGRLTQNTPTAWTDWVKHGRYRALGVAQIICDVERDEINIRMFATDIPHRGLPIKLSRF